MDFKFGVLPSPYDKRDYPITKLVPKLNVFPPTFSLVFDKLEIHDQKEVGGCVSFSLTEIKEIQEYNEKKTYTHFSPLFIYGNRSKTDYQEEGMIPSQALKHLKDEGVCEESLFPSIVEVPKAYEIFQQNVTKEILDNASKYKISAYAKLNNTDDIKTALKQIGAVLVCVPIYESFYQIKEDGIVSEPNGNLLGYHAMVIVGWDDYKNSWLILNSWGSSWANKGYCWYNYNFPIQEAWSVSDYIEPNHEQKYYLVLVGKFLSRRDAEKFMKKFKFKSHLIMKDDKISIQMGAFKTKELAQACVKKYARFKPYIVFE